MLLDALLAAGDRLIVTYTGNDERTNIARPPAVPVGELLDIVDRTAGPAAREQVVVEHPLQPFDPRNFTVGRLVPAKPWSFDHVTLKGARALAGARVPAPPFLAAPLPDERAPVVELEDLVRFTANPVQAFLRQRLDIGVRDYSTETADALPVELDGLELWRIGDRILSARLAGAGMEEAVAAEVARGALPPGGLGEAAAARVRPVVDEIVAQAGPAETVSVDVRIVLPDGRPLSGTVPGVAGSVLRSVSYSRVNARQRIGAWVRLLALTVAQPERRFEAMVVGRGSDGMSAAVVRLPPLTAERASHELAVLADLYDRGMREPLPIGCLSSAAYAAAARAGGNAVAAGRAAWESTWNFSQEDAQPEHELVFGRVLRFDELLELPLADGEDWDPGETTRFARLARRLWDPLLEHEDPS
jgi:exodeoxyribonuclease V gamma subunit